MITIVFPFGQKDVSYDIGLEKFCNDPQNQG